MNGVKIELTIKEANSEIERNQNLLNLYIDRKNILFDDTQPKSKDLSLENVDGTPTREEKFYKYVYKCNKEDIDWWIDKLNEDIVLLNDYIESELKRIGKYDKLKKKIYDLRNDNKYMREHGGKPMEWWKISEAVGYCERQCRRIYSKMIGKRYNGE